MGKHCKCYERSFVVDTDNRQVYCSKCGAWIDPYEAIYEIARDRERIVDENRRLYEQRKQIVNYKPHMIVFRNLESHYRGKKMLPNCPNCMKGFYFEEINTWTNRELVDFWRQRERQDALIEKLKQENARKPGLWIDG